MENDTTNQNKPLPSDFIWRRLHSISGFLLVIFIMFHLFTNAQAAFPIGSDGQSFIHSVNAIHATPFLLIVEIIVLVLPILIHMLYGIKYLRTASYNSFGSDGKTPYLPEYPRNHAYTWQRITSWMLILLIIAHVIHMRVIEYPTPIFQSGSTHHMVWLTKDPGLESLSKRLNVELFDTENIEAVKANNLNNLHLEKVLEKRPLKPNEVIAVSDSFGTAELLMVRDTFKMPIMLFLYSVLVLAACFHAFNGLWTFMISWGVTLTTRSQNLMRLFTSVLMLIFTLLGLSAIWLTYLVNLKG